MTRPWLGPRIKRERGHSPRRATYVHGFAVGSATFAVNAIVSLISAIATARLYGAVVIGQYALAYAPVGTAWYLSTVQEQPALVRKLAVLEPRDPRVTSLWLAVAIFSQTLTTVVVIVAASLSVFVFRGPLHQPGLVAPALTMFAGYLLLANPGWNIDTLFASFRAARELFAVRCHQMVIFVIAAVALRYVTDSVWGLVGALLCSYGSSLVHRAFVARRFLTLDVSRGELRGGLRELRQIVRFGFKVVPGQLSAGISGLAGTWILGAFVPVGTVGAWSRASTIASRLQDMDNRTVDMLLPTLVERNATGDVAGFHRALVDSMRYVVVILLLPAAVAGGAASRLLMLLFGPHFTSASGALVLLVLLPVLLGITAFGAQALIALNRPITTTVLEAARMLITISAGLALTSAYGSTGMAAAMVLGCVVEAGAVAMLMTRQLKTPVGRLWPLRSFGAIVAGYFGGFAASHVSATLVPGAGGTLLAVAAGTATYLGCVLRLGGVFGRDWDRARNIIATRRATVTQQTTAAA